MTVESSDFEQWLSSVEVFKILGSETRLAILQELFDTYPRPLSFSELRKRLGMRDGSQFNYHLSRLERGFVGKSEEGYYIRPAGVNVIRAILGGVFAAHPKINPPGVCASCPAGIRAWSGDEYTLIECSECDSLYVLNTLPPVDSPTESPEGCPKQKTPKYVTATL